MSEIDPRQSRELMLTPTAAVDIAIANILPEVADRAGIEGPLTAKSKKELLELTIAVRKAVQQHGRDHEGKPPTKQEREIARLGGVIVMTDNLTKQGFLTKPEEVEDLTSSVIDSRYDPSAVVRVAKNPRKFLGVESITPRKLGNVINVWGELSLTDSSDGPARNPASKDIDVEARIVTPSIKQIHDVLLSVGADIDHLVDDETIDYVGGVLAVSRFSVTPQLRSDPLGDMLPSERYSIRATTVRSLSHSAMSHELGFEPPERFYDPDEASLFDDPWIEDEWSLGAADAAEYVREHPSQ